MHQSVLDWVRGRVDSFGIADAAVIEVGSYDVNGSVRSFFRGEYVGVDMRPGPGVDRVAPASALPFEDGSFDVVVSTEMLEHDRTFWLSLPEMARVLRPEGLLILTARATGFPAHDFPCDYWRFSPDGFLALFELADLDPVEVVPDPDPLSPGVFGVARKKA